MKNRIHLAIAFLLLAASLAAQNTPISSVRIYTEPSGARFYVDGVMYVASQTFLWPQGSKHIVQFPVNTYSDGTYQQSLDGSIRYTFGGWADSSGFSSPDPNYTFTASASTTSLKATLGVAYRTMLRFLSGNGTALDCTGAPGNAPQDGVRNGVVYIDGSCFGNNADLYLPAGTHTLAAFPYPGFVFTSWSINGATTPAAAFAATLAGATTVYVAFQPSKRAQFLTSPLGLQVLVDRSPVPTTSTYIVDPILGPASPASQTCDSNLGLPPAPPVTIPAACLGSFDFIPGSKHVLAAVSPQADRTGKQWVFDSFSNGLGLNGVYTADQNTSITDFVTAKFVPAVQVAFLTIPSGLKVSVDGRSNWQSYNFIWGAGTTHQVSAAATQVDSSGRTWTFKSWSNGGAANQDFTADAANPNVRWTATYTGLGQVRVLTNPIGMKIQVDGAECTTPCTFDRAPGTEMKIVAPASTSLTDSARLDFQGWSDGASLSRSYTFTSDVQTIFANYATSYRLLAASDPDSGVNFKFDPPSADQYYPSDTQVVVTAMARAGFKFRRWGGDLAGVYNVGQLTVSGPRAVVAMLDRVPYIAPAGIKNAAGDTPDGTVAPGSIISIYGESLAPQLAVSTSNPLSQTLADVVVTVSDRILPLLYVSPQQINAQVPSDLPDGQYALKVQWTGKPDVLATFTVARNSPGLYSRPVDSQPFSMAVHEDGTPISPDSPARKGELVTLYGTGFGPYNGKVIDGFILPVPSDFVVVDPVQITAGDTPLQPDWTGGAPGFVGTVITRFRIGDQLPAAATVELKVSVNGKFSNTVLLPLE